MIEGGTYWDRIRRELYTAVIWQDVSRRTLAQSTSYTGERIARKAQTKMTERKGNAMAKSRSGKAYRKGLSLTQIIRMFPDNEPDRK